MEQASIQWSTAFKGSELKPPLAFGNFEPHTVEWSYIYFWPNIGQVGHRAEPIIKLLQLEGLMSITTVFNIKL